MLQLVRGIPRRTGTVALVAILAAASLSLLTSCGSEKNPILGEWDVTVKTGNTGVDAAVGIFTAMRKPSIVFTETDMRLQGLGPIDGARPVTYRKDKEGRWTVCFGSEGGKCQFFSFQDDQRTRAAFTALGMELSLVKKPDPVES
jgi:hypothetical protein